MVHSSNVLGTRGTLGARRKAFGLIGPKSLMPRTTHKPAAGLVSLLEAFSGAVSITWGCLCEHDVGPETWSRESDAHPSLLHLPLASPLALHLGRASAQTHNIEVTWVVVKTMVPFWVP